MLLSLVLYLHPCHVSERARVDWLAAADESGQLHTMLKQLFPPLPPTPLSEDDSIGVWAASGEAGAEEETEEEGALSAPRPVAGLLADGEAAGGDGATGGRDSGREGGAALRYGDEPAGADRGRDVGEVLGEANVAMSVGEGAAAAVAAEAAASVCELADAEEGTEDATGAIPQDHPVMQRCVGVAWRDAVMRLVCMYDSVFSG